MLRSMYSGITGLQANQTKLDVVGNNIANVGTTAFKSQRIRFSDNLSQTMQNASAPGYSIGGTNAKQIGLGTQVAGVDTITSQGNMQPTSRNLDCAIDGDGYFMVGRGSVPTDNSEGVSVNSDSHEMGNGNGMQVSYTRDGSFTLDYAGNLLTSDGLRILGYPLTEAGANNNASVDYSKNGVCNFVDSDSEAGLKQAQSTLVPLKIPDYVHINPTQNPVQADGTTLKPIEMPYTGSSTKPTAPTITIGTDVATSTYTGKGDLNINVKWDSQFVSDATTTPPTITPSYVVSVNGNDAVAVANAGTAVTGLTITDPTDATKTKNATLADLGISMGAPTDSGSDKNSWSYTVRADGDQKLRNFSIEKDGIIKGVLADGRVTALGQIAMSTFKNPGGLMKSGKNLYTSSSNSGSPSIRSSVGTDPASDNSDGYGDCLNGVLEMSNVDLAAQFTDMIIASRAFQANGKMITTGDEILQDLVNLKR